MCLGLDYFGYRSVVLGDLKPDYAELIAALGGNVVTLGRGHGTLNVLDPGAAVAAAGRLTGRARKELIADSHGRRLNLVAALVALNRGVAAQRHRRSRPVGRPAGPGRAPRARARRY